MALACGASTYSWLWDLSLEEAVHRIANMGFKYFELMSAPLHCWPRGWSQADRTAFRKLYKSRGLLFLLVFGCLMETAAAIIMLVPILAPISASYGIHLLHFGFVVVSGDRPPYAALGNGPVCRLRPGQHLHRAAVPTRLAPSGLAINRLGPRHLLSGIDVVDPAALWVCMSPSGAVQLPSQAVTNSEETS